MPWLLLGVGSLAGVILDNFLDDSPSAEEAVARKSLAEAEAERLARIKSIVTSITILVTVIGTIYLLASSGILKK